ncbi:hypothetical protein DOT_4798 [Desulfosporosinus sp. OT]|nr:hypothetical protein DOT_4798 [Desulfosporosinus sp. OT]
MGKINVSWPKIELKAEARLCHAGLLLIIDTTTNDLYALHYMACPVKCDKALVFNIP